MRGFLIFLNFSTVAQGQIIRRHASSMSHNPVAGRLYLQPIGNYPSQIVDSMKVDFKYTQVAEYNNKMGRENKINMSLFSARLSKGFSDFELGLQTRFYSDERDNFLSKLLYVYHKTFNQTHRIPSSNSQFEFVIGENNHSVAYINQTMIHSDVWIKFPLIINEEYLSALKIVYRQPFSHYNLNTKGYGLALGIEKLINNFSSMYLSYALSKQEISNTDFQSSILEVKQYSHQFVFGFFFQKSTLSCCHFDFNFRSSSSKVKSKNDKKDVLPLVLNGSVVIPRNFADFYIEFSEDIPYPAPYNPPHLETDFVLSVGFEKTF